MRLYRLKRETTVADIGLFNAQLFVGELSDSKGNRIKGMAILIPNRWFEMPFAVQKDDALSLSHLLKQVTPKEPSMTFSVSLGWISRFRFSLDEYLDKWLNNDGYSGRVSIYGNWIPIKISGSAVRELSDCLERFYQS